MFKFDKGTKKRSDFARGEAGLEAYLSYIYDQNQSAFENPDHFLLNEMETKREFIGNIKSRMREGNVNVSSALKQKANSKQFTSVGDRAVDNMIKGIRHFDSGETWREFRELTKDSHGRYTKVDPSKFQWDSDLHAYVYDDKFYINTTNSPVMLTFIKL